MYRASPQRLREDVGQEAQIAQDYRGRLIYELLQNADDAMAGEPASASCIRFTLTDDALWVGNSGRALDEADVRGLCGISASRKTQHAGKRRASIGHKGMGFKSVLEITEAPEVYSTTLSFRFGPADALRAVHQLVSERILEPVTRAPICRFPWHVDHRQEVWDEMRAQGLRTAFRFPLHARMTGDQQGRLAQALRELPITALLFLKHLGRVEIEIYRGDSHERFVWTVRRQRRSGRDWSDVHGFSEAGTYRVMLSADTGEIESFLLAYDGDIEIGNHRGGLDEFTWEGVAYTEVSVAARLVRSSVAPLKPDWRKLHVFLPTAEPCPYDLLVSGAFNSNLSRQEIRVETDAENYNCFLLYESGRILRDQLIPALVGNGTSVVEILRLLDRGVPVGTRCSTNAAQVLYEGTREALGNLLFIPAEVGPPLAIVSCTVPPLVSDHEVGRDFRAMLSDDVTFLGKPLPSTELCGSDIARVLADHGTQTLDPTQAAGVLAQADPVRSKLGVQGKRFVDPVLRVLERLWVGLGSDEREQLARAARREPLFPVGIMQGDTPRRVVTEGVACFYPPRSLHGEVPLDGLCFLMQEISWGDLTPKERTLELRQEMASWQALFDVREFKFPEVMRASVLPALDLEHDLEGRPQRLALHTLERVAAICQLAGRTPNRNAPLPYERIGPNRALFNLSRLDVPCRSSSDSEIRWIPAYQAYLGEDWIGQNSAECVFAAARDLQTADLPDAHFVLAPERFGGLLDRYRYLGEAAQSAEEADVGQDEVSVDEDEEAALDADDRTRWLDFFLWLGVNQSLRPVHFHDVEDRASGWLRTAKLRRPDGWIFQNVQQPTWNRYAETVRQALVRADPECFGATEAYFYKVHDLEHLLVLLAAASQDLTAGLGRSLYEHLARNWSSLERFSRAVIAQVPLSERPSMRSKPPQARNDELVEPEEDFWVFRLRSAAFCPTGHGPRPAASVWLPTMEVQRRFGRQAGGGMSCLLPTLDVDPLVIKGKARGFAHALGLREELSASTFTLDDARTLLLRIRDLYSAPLAAAQDLRQELREVIRPAYRNLFELLTGGDYMADEIGATTAPLADEPLLVHDGRANWKFLPASDAFYIERRDTRDRLQTAEPIWSFVLEAFPAARSPLVRLFGVRVLEEELQWTPRPGDPALVEADLEEFRARLVDLGPYVLARVGADRVDDRLARQDARQLRQLVERIEPVSRLELRCELDGHDLNIDALQRDAFVNIQAGEPAQAFVVWGEHPWPPDDRDAEALAGAFCEILGSGYFESFLALAKAGSSTARERLLKRAGALLDIEEKKSLFHARAATPDTEGASVDIGEPRTAVTREDGEQPPVQPGNPTADDTPAPERIPLFDPGDILVDGEPVRTVGHVAPEPFPPATNRPPGNGSRPDPRRQTGYGGHTDLEALNTLGMYITLSFERGRLRRGGLPNAEIVDPSSNVEQPDVFVFDVSTAERIAHARRVSPRFDEAMIKLSRQFGISIEWPGFDVLSLDPRTPEIFDRMIELKSSGVASRIQEMRWNEWKTARASKLREHYYLYLVGNLRSDLRGSVPFLRVIRNPFEQLVAEVQANRVLERKVQLSVHLFQEAEHLDLTVRRDGVGQRAE